MTVIINLRALNFDPMSYSADFSSDLSLSYIEWWGDKPFVDDIKITGTIVKQSDGYLMNYTADFTYEVRCARCLKEVKKHDSQSFQHDLKDFADLEHQPEDVISINRDNLDLTEMVVSDLLPQLPDIVLCHEDCSGLCPICGGNLDEVKCDCKKETITDSRFSVLRELLREID